MIATAMLPSVVERCGKGFSIDHALDYFLGKQHHQHEEGVDRGALDNMFQRSVLGEPFSRFGRVENHHHLGNDQ